MPYLGTAPASELANLDINGQKFILDADADTHITADTDDQIDIAISGADDFQFTANKFLVQTGSNLDMNGTELILDADADTSITADTDDQIDIRIAGADDFQFTANTFTAQSGSTIAAQALTAAGLITTSAGIKADDGSTSTPSLHGTTSTNAGIFFPAADHMSVTIGGSELTRFGSNSILHNETANTSSTIGVTINQGGQDNEIFALKSADVAHPFTAVAETDTYASFVKSGADRGGLVVQAFIETGANTGVALRSFIVSEDLSDSTGSRAAIETQSYVTDASTSHQDMQATANIIAFKNRNTTRVIFKADGTVHASDTSWATALDEHDDMLALRMLDKAQSTSGIIDSAWDSMIGMDWEYLQKIGVAGSTHPEKGRPDMFSIQGIQKLTMGATWYLGQNFMAFLETVEKHMPGIRKEYEEHMLAQSGRPAMLTQAAN
jgi:hypothetical protein